MTCPLPPTTRVALTVDGMDWYGWTSVQIERSMEQACGTFQLGLVEQWRGSARRRIGPGAACILSIDGEAVLKGFVDDAEPAYDAETHDVVVKGRDAAGDLVDCAVLPPWEFKNLGLTDIATRLARPFGITVRADVDVGKPFDRYAVQPGETVWESIEKAARMRDVLVMSDGRGGILLTRAGTGIAPDILELGRNILAGKGTFSFSDRFSAYHALGQQEGSDALGDPAEAASPSAIVTDPAVKRYRPTIVNGEAAGDRKTLQQRAEWQKAVAAGKSKRATYIVQDWRANGRLWKPNTRVAVLDDFVNLAGAELLIPKVTFLLSEAGTTTQIEVAPLDAYRPEPGAAEKAAKAATGKAKSGGAAGSDDAFSLWDDA